MGQKSSVVYDAKVLSVAIKYESELPYQGPKLNFRCKPKAYPSKNLTSANIVKCAEVTRPVFTPAGANSRVWNANFTTS